MTSKISVMSIRIDDDLRTELKTWCAKNRKKMREVIGELVSGFLKEKQMELEHLEEQKRELKKEQRQEKMFDTGRDVV